MAPLSALVRVVDDALRPLRDRHYLVLPRKKLAYARVPKAANSSVKRALFQLEFPRRDVDAVGKKINRDAFWSRRDPKRAHLATAADVVAREDALLIFAVVRNPFARLLSCYRDKIEAREVTLPALAYTGFRTDMSFREFVLHACTVGDRFADNHLRSQADILGFGGRLIPTHVCHLEHLERDWTRLSRAVGAHTGKPLPALAHKNRQPAALPLADVYDAAMVRAVRRRYAADFEAFYPDFADP